MPPHDPLPAADWTRRAGLAQLVSALGADRVRYVGGAVRDTLLGLPVRDVDCATTLLPDDIMAACRQAGLRTIPTGIAHGTVTIILPGGPVEVTTLRRDVATDGRHATVAFASEWQDDAARRDFTINALYADPRTLAIADYFDGLADLTARRVRFIGDARQRIREDHLRILRYFRFEARFGDIPDASAMAACADLADTLKGLSRERIANELLLLLGLPDPAPSIRLMAETGVLPVILPEAKESQLTKLEMLVRHEAACAIPADPIRRLSALLPAHTHLADAVAARLRLSKAQRLRLTMAAERNASDTDRARALAYEVGLEVAIDRLLLLGAPIDPLEGWMPPALPLKGRDIIAAGVVAGPRVARILQAVEARWVAEDFPPESTVREWLTELVNPER